MYKKEENLPDISPESKYEQIADKTKRKKLGQFFTPKSLADAMAAWVGHVKGDRFLDPALGAGILTDSLYSIRPNTYVLGLEIDPDLADIAIQRLDKRIEVRVGDYLETNFTEKFDGIVANPPYIRHHDFKAAKVNYEEQTFGRLSKLTNIYVLFLAKIISDLKPDGRAAVLIPSDWTSANFGEPVKRWLTESGILRRLVIFDADGEVFHDNLSTGSILFLENNPNPDASVQVVLAPSNLSPDLASSLGMPKIEEHKNLVIRSVKFAELNPREKWLSLLSGEVEPIPQGYNALELFAKSSRGIATGANDFFLVSNSTFAAETPRAQFRNCIGRAKDANGLIFSDFDLDQLNLKDTPTKLLDLDGTSDSDYLRRGEIRGLPSRYLLKTRKRWFDQEVRQPPDILVGVFGRDGARFIFNEAQVVALTCFHGIYTGLDALTNKALAALLNSSHLQDLNLRHQRSYGSGLTKVEPKDILKMVVPNLEALSRPTISALAESLELADIAFRMKSQGWRKEIDKVVTHLDLKKLSD